MNEKKIYEYTAKVVKALKLLGVNIGTRGYDYIKDALIIIAKEDTLSKRGTMSLYQEVASKYNDSSAIKVERCIRNFVNNAFEEGNSFYSKAVGVTDKKPTNSHFLKAMSDYLKYNNV